MKEIKIVGYSDMYLDACLEVALKAETVYEASNAQILGNDIHSVAMKFWKEDLDEAVRTALSQQPCLVALAEDQVIGFTVYRFAGHVGVIAQYAVDPAEDITVVGPMLFRAAFDKMKAEGVTHVMANCGMEAVHDNDRKAFEAVGFERYLPHVKYYQILGEAPVLRETKLKIVPCQPEHIPDCARIAVQVWEGIHAAYTEYQGEELHEAFSSGWRESKKEDIYRQQSRPTSIVALLDGKVVGFCGYRVEHGNLGVIGYNGVDPEYRGNGIARYLYEYCFAEMRKQGITHARVFTGGDNGHAPARRAYEKAGYNKRLLSLTYYMAL